MILGIRGHFSDAIICVSCSGRNFPEFERRSEVLELTGAARPDLASLTLTSLDFPTGTSQNAPDMVLALAREDDRPGHQAGARVLRLRHDQRGQHAHRQGPAGRRPALLQPAARLALLGSRHCPAPVEHAGGPAAGLSLVGGRDRALSAPDERPRDRHGRALPRGTGGQHLPRLRPGRAGHQRRTGRAGGRTSARRSAGPWPAPRAPARCWGSADRPHARSRPAIGSVRP